MQFLFPAIQSLGRACDSVPGQPVDHILSCQFAECKPSTYKIRPQSYLKIRLICEMQNDPEDESMDLAAQYLRLPKLYHSPQVT